MSVTVFVEGGGNKATDSACKQGFRSLLTRAGFAGRRPKVIPCGSRKDAYDDFKTALRNGDEYPILLVDSEDPVADANLPDAEPGGAWRHLAQRADDRWERPSGADDDQAQLMVTTMETWLIADRQAVIAYFPGMNANALPPDSELESRRKRDVIDDGLQRATQRSSKGRYHKGNHAFDLLGRVDPDELRRRLPHFQRFVDALDSHLSTTSRAP